MDPVVGVVFEEVVIHPTNEPQDDGDQRIHHKTCKWGCGKGSSWPTKEIQPSYRLCCGQLEKECISSWLPGIWNCHDIPFLTPSHPSSHPSSHLFTTTGATHQAVWNGGEGLRGHEEGKVSPGQPQQMFAAEDTPYMDDTKSPPFTLSIYSMIDLLEVLYHVCCEQYS